MKRVFVLIVISLICFEVKGQNETLNWYFGNKAALNFDGGIRTVLNDSQMNAPYGTTTISNKQGELMFYSDGESVWNRSHQIMTNGQGLNGNKANTQSSIVIPKPGDENTYYLFTTSTSSGLHYHTIEFNAQNPLGIVTQKNISLTTSTLHRPTEKITAIHHENGRDIWVITMKKLFTDNDVNSFLVYRVSDSGVSLNPVVSGGPDNASEAGQLTISPNGKKLAVATKTRFFYMYDFNTQNGEVSFDYLANTAITIGVTDFVYGVAFSPDSKKMYMSVAYNVGGREEFGILQSDLTVPRIVDSPPYGDHIFRSRLYEPGNLQISIDGNLYVALAQRSAAGPSDFQFLGYIENPEESYVGSTVILNQLDLETGKSIQGLPNFIQSYFATRILTENQCFVDPFAFTAESYTTISNIDWDFGDGNTANGLNVNHTYASPGLYTVRANVTINGSEVSVFKIVEAYALPILNPNEELVECDEDSDGISLFNLTSIEERISINASRETFSYFKTLNDAQQNTNPIANPQAYVNSVPNEEIFVRSVNENGCFQVGSFRVIANFVQIGNIPEYFTCEVENGNGEFNTSAVLDHINANLSIAPGTTLRLYPSLQEAQTNSNEFESVFNQPTSTIYVKGFNADKSCAGITTMQLTVNPLPTINLNDSYEICFDPTVKAPVIASVALGFDSYEWTDSAGNTLSTSNELTLQRIGQFQLTVTKLENGILCSNTKSFEVNNPLKPSFGQILVNTENPANNTVEVNIVGNSSYLYSLDNVNFTGSGLNHLFSQVTPGIRTIYVRDANECEEPIQLDVSVIGFKKFFSPNGDGNNDYWNITGLSANDFKSVDVKIYNRFGNIVGSITDFTSLGWDGTFNGKAQISNSYWYTAIIVDNNDNVIKETGNFSLVRE
ncbi:MAG: hypothetical protein CMB99_11570 [Flavobacteriaceae bacterium]|nr:hypothetical protein [Flavobacteriaceae bacterium]|tara:strand:- start:250849 stop:253542 length:2694 start_codon:yes stop_codon:yes gene_type:complete